jgi:hypothetical protein
VSKLKLIVDNTKKEVPPVDPWMDSYNPPHSPPKIEKKHVFVGDEELIAVIKKQRKNNMALNAGANRLA